MKRGALQQALWPTVFLLIIAQGVFVAGYVGHEHTVYFWDHAMYFNMAQQAYTVFGESFTNYAAMFRASLADNYNLIFTLPSLVTFSLSDVSRETFIVTNFFCYFLLYEVAVALLLRRALGLRWGLALALSLVAASLTPPLWLPLLEGYPDNGAAACLVFAAAIGWSGALAKRFIWRAIGVGFFLGLAVLLRRHFAYPAIAVLLSLGCLELWQIICEKPKDRWPHVRQAAVYFFICGFGFLATLAIVAPDFLKSALTINYSQLYISYKKPPTVFLYFILGGFGYGLLLLACDGLWLLSRVSEAGKKLSVFAATFVLLWLVLWCLGPDQMGHHYMLHALPFGVAMGLAGWFVAGLATHSLWAMWLSPHGVWPNDNGTPGLLSAARPPVVRKDYEEWHRLGAYLQRTTKPTDKIMMVGSSFILNLDLLNSVFKDLQDTKDMITRFPKNPEIDHEEPAPFDAFAGSNVYIVPTPAQYHLDPASQLVIKSAADQFPPPPSRAGTFHADDDVFHLEDGVTVMIWRRDPWTPEALHAALADIRREGPQDANLNQAWAAVGLPLRDHIVTDANYITGVSALLGPETKTFRLFFDYPLEAGNQRLVFTYATDCQAPAFQLQILSGDGKENVTKNIPALARQDASADAKFAVSDTEGGRYLKLGFSSAPVTLCRVEMRGLRVEKITD
jgi:hypothetical protein